MTTDTRRCAKCGNVIPGWSAGVCPVCERISWTEKRFWKSGRKHRRPRPRAEEPAARHPVRRAQTKSPATNPGRPAARADAGPRQKRLKPGTRGWQRLAAFNRLLRDVYGKHVLFRHLLGKQGVLESQIGTWRRDGLWLIRFMRRLESDLLTWIAEKLTAPQARAFGLWYGLDGKGCRWPTAIAAELGVKAWEVQVVHKKVLALLHHPSGRAALEQMVLAAARAADEPDPD